jgi:hypothetical protein
MVGRDGEIINFEKNSSRIFDKGDVIETLYLNISDYVKRYNAAESPAMGSMIFKYDFLLFIVQF